MKTVPTLCATATAVGVSTVGLSLGRPISNKDTAARKNTAVANEMVDSVLTPSRHINSCSSPLNPSPLPSHPFEHRNHNARPQRLKRRMTTSNAAPEPQFHAAQMHPPVEEYNSMDVDFRSALRPQTSWIKRLSNLSSQASSNDCDSRPVSPSVSYSNGSVAFSHAGSTAPIIGHSTPAPLPPNKLVKRSTSVRSINAVPRTSSSRMPTLRRPATSHQRSATMQHQSMLDKPVDEDSVNNFYHSDPFSKTEGQYTQFFSARISKDRIGARRRSDNGDVRTIKRIIPDATHQPTLVLAKSVVASSLELDESSSHDGESVYYSSRPATPPFPPTQEQISHQPLETSEAASTRIIEEGISHEKTRRSFSLSDYITSTPYLKKPRAGKPTGTKLLRRTSKRTASAPVPPSSDLTVSANERSSSDQAPPRRLITDPILSHRKLEEALSSPQNLNDAHTSGTNSISPESIATYSAPNTSHTPRPRVSTAASEQASTLVGSDHDIREFGSGEDDELDFQSDTMFDSIRTRATRSSSSARGPQIEAIFHESSPSLTKANMQALRDLFPKSGTRLTPVESFAGTGIKEEDEHTVSPGKTVSSTEKMEHSPASARRTSNPLFPTNVPSPSPDHPKPLNLGTLEWDAVLEGDDDQWSFSDQEDGIPGQPLIVQPPSIAVQAKPSTPRSFRTNSRVSTPQQNQSEIGDRDARSSIFDWSEQRPADKSPANGTPPRPSTVHGKKDADGRGSRSMGRRAPSGLHARSQSVPVVPDLGGKRETVVTNKFGTWGVGSKGVTEDWNDDFDFNGPAEPSIIDEEDNVRVDSGLTMFVPKSIREQQSNVLANIGLLREWGLLIEELKELRIRAATVGLLANQSRDTWQEVDAMIELADQEAEEDPFGGFPSRASSPGFEADGFEDFAVPVPTANQTPRKISAGRATDFASHSLLNPQQGKSRRRSILTATNDLFTPTSTPPPSKFRNSSQNASPATTSSPVPTNRPRKDSEAVALSVIEALRKHKGTSDASPSQKPASPTKKVPFDTATLRHIVPYVNGLMRRVKEDLREAEGLYSSPNHSPKGHDIPLSHLFIGSDGDSPSSRKKRRPRGNDSEFPTKDGDITSPMKLMTVM